MKKGFTLIEVLATFSIVLLLIMIIVPTVAGQIQKTKETALTTQISLIKKAAANYVLNHPEDMDEYNLNANYVSLTDLKSMKYLDNVTIKNPVTKKVMDGCVVITYDNDNSSYQYDYQDATCDSLKISTTRLISAYETITGNSNKSKENGLYEIDNEYVYRGSNPNNYLTINNNMYRILSLNKEDKTIKIIKDSGEDKIWQENNNTQDFTYRLSSIYAYLNTNFYQTLADSFKKHMVENSTWYVGIDKMDKADVTTLKSINQTSTVNANVGLLSAYEYARVSMNKECQSNYLDSSCNGKNYLAKNKKTWLLNSDATTIWYVDDAGQIKATNKPGTAYVYPVITLKPNITLTGEGTKDQPFVLNFSE